MCLLSEAHFLRLFFATNFENTQKLSFRIQNAIHCMKRTIFPRFQRVFMLHLNSSYSDTKTGLLRSKIVKTFFSDMECNGNLIFKTDANSLKRGEIPATRRGCFLPKLPNWVMLAGLFCSPPPLSFFRGKISNSVSNWPD